MDSPRESLEVLRDILDEASVILSADPPLAGAPARCRELITSAAAITDDLLQKPTSAAALGAKGGKRTAQRGSEYFKQIANMRKTRSGGRPKKGLN